MTDADAIVAGAGPAGSIAAIVLARAGARVLLLDRAQFPRDKLCGDTINPGALAILRQLGLSAAADDGTPVDGMIVTGPGDVRVEARYERGVTGRALLRRILDDSLLRAAVAAGVRVEENTLAIGPIVDTAHAPRVTGVRVRGPGGGSIRLTAPVVVAADGRASRIARAVHLSRAVSRPRRWAVGAYFEDVAGNTTCGEMHVRRGRYIGLAPLPRHLTNVCVVTSDLAAVRDPDALIAGAVTEDPALAGRFAAARMIASPVSLGPLGVDCDVPGMSGLLLAGDAAGFIDPMTGDGLRFAFRGGALAGEHAVRALTGGWLDAHIALGNARRRDFIAKWRFNRALRALVESPAGVLAAGYGARMAPSVLAQVIRFAGDIAVAA
jgi:flavin-dependent dehydrogenase